jgi:hypothetical protein
MPLYQIEMSRVETLSLIGFVEISKQRMQVKFLAHHSHSLWWEGCWGFYRLGVTERKIVVYLRTDTCFIL